MGRILSRATRRRTQQQIRYVAPVPPGSADAPVATVYGQVEREFGLLAPPMSLHAPAPEVLAGAWLMLRESLVATGQVPRAVKEAVAVAVSGLNACSYCADVHSIALAGLTGGELVDPQPGGLRRSRWAGLADWVGRCDLNLPAGPAPGPAAHLPEVIGTAVTFHYLNRMVNVFLVESPIPAHLSGSARGRVRRVAARLLGPVLRRSVPPGRAAGLLPAAPLPEDLGWAAGSPPVADAFARAAAAVEAAAAVSVPAEVRELLARELADWDGCPPGLGDWPRARVARLPAGQRPAARFALLTALASYQVTDQLVAELRRAGYDDRRLIETAAWASLSAARRVGAWLASGGAAHSPSPGADTPAGR